MRFDVCAHTYDEHAGPQRFFAERVAQFIGVGQAFSLSQIEIKDGDRLEACPRRILELGAGTGALTQWLAGAGGAAGQPTPDPSQEGIAVARAGDLTPSAASGCLAPVPLLATDASPAMVEHGRMAVPQAQWSVLEAFNQPLPVADLQVSSGLLHWADDPSALLARWKTFLVPDGRMVDAMPCEPCLKEWRALVPESPVPWRSEAEWLEIFERAGLRVMRLERWTHNAVCGSALEMVRGFHRTGVTGRLRVGPARLRQALREYGRRHQVPGGVQATWVWLAVAAVPAVE